MDTSHQQPMMTALISKPGSFLGSDGEQYLVPCL